MKSISVRMIIFGFLLISTVLAQNQVSSKEKVDKKMYIAVLELDPAGITTDESKILTDRLRYELFETNKFVVLERSKMEDILKEQSFQMSGCTSDECLIEIGRLVGVQAMVGGSVGKIGNLYTLNVRLIDVETATVIRNAVVDYRGTLDGLLTEGIKRVARKLAGLDNSKNSLVTNTNETVNKPVQTAKEEQPVQKKTAQEEKKYPETIHRRKSFRRLDLDFGFGNGEVKFEVINQFNIVVASRTFSMKTIYLSAQFNLTRKLGIIAGIAGSPGPYQNDQPTSSNQYEVMSVDYTQFFIGIEYRLFKFFSIGIGSANSSAQIEFIDADKNRIIKSHGLYLRPGFHLPLSSRFQLDLYGHNASGKNPGVSYFTFGIDFKL